MGDQLGELTFTPIRAQLSGFRSSSKQSWCWHFSQGRSRASRSWARVWVFHSGFFFNWKIIALHYCVGFCRTTMWLIRKDTYVPSLLSSHPSRLSQRTRLDPCTSSSFPLAICFAYGSADMSTPLSQLIPPCPSFAVSKVCSLRLYSYPANRCICTIFLAALYMC